MRYPCLECTENDPQSKRQALDGHKHSRPGSGGERIYQKEPLTLAQLALHCASNLRLLLAPDHVSTASPCFLWGSSLPSVFFQHGIHYVIFKTSICIIFQGFLSLKDQCLISPSAPVPSALPDRGYLWRSAWTREVNWFGLFISIPKSKCFQENLLGGTRLLPRNIPTFCITQPHKTF